MRAHVASAGIAFLTFATFTFAARSQSADGGTPTPEAAPAQPTPAAPDVVKLRDGSLFRGTISERVPNDYVEIVLMSGKNRRFNMSDVEFAGPAAEMPAAAPVPAPAPSAPVAPAGGTSTQLRPLITVSGPEAKVRVVGDVGLTLHRRAASAAAGNIVAEGFDEVCTVPCDVSLPAGTYTFGLSTGHKKVILTDPVTIPPGASRLEGHLVSQSALRWGVALGGAAATGVGGYLMLTSSEDTQECDSTGCVPTTKLNETKLIGGSALLAVGLFGLIEAFSIPDKAKLRVVPTPAPALAQPRAGSLNGELGRSVIPGGLTISGRF